MRGKRFFWFLVMIALGAVLGMLYGWVVRPVGGNESTPNALRYDYQADYVLMTAEVFAADGDLDQAVNNLLLLGNQPPAQTASQGLQSARALDWPQADLDKLELLVQSLEGPTPQPTRTPEGGDQP